MGSFQNWTKKYAPEKISEVIGQNLATRQIMDFLADFKNKKKKALILYGPSGVGKTISVYCAAKQINYEIIELNASDFRNKEKITTILGNAITQQSLFSKGKIVLIDEIDGLSGTKDRGGLAAVKNLISDAKFPVIMTVANIYDFKLSSIKSKSELVGFKPVDSENIAKLLEKICKNENVKAKTLVLRDIANRSGGDVRSAINDLQSIAMSKKEITRKDLDFISDRNKIESMPKALIKILKTKNPEIALSAFENVNEDIDAQFLWLDANIPLEYKNPEDLASAYDKLSRADVFKGRIRRWQHWRFLVYVTSLLTAGVASSKKEKYLGFVDYKPTGRLLKMYWANIRNAKKKAIAEKVAASTHTSKKEAIKSTVPYMQHIFKNNKKMSEEIAKQLDLTKDEVEWLRK